MKSKMLMMLMLVGLFAIGASTGATCQTGQAITGDVGTVASCVIQHAATDAVPSYENIAEECGGVAVAAVIQIVEELITVEEGDAGAPTTTSRRMRAVHHRALK